MNFPRCLLKKLLRNALAAHCETLDNAGCNDIFADEPLLKGISAAERKILDAYWKENIKNQEEHDAEDNEISMDVELLSVIQQMLDNTALVDGSYQYCDKIHKSFKAEGFDVAEVYSEVDDSNEPSVGFVVVMNEPEPRENSKRKQAAEYLLRDYAYRIEWKKLRKIRVPAKA